MEDWKKLQNEINQAAAAAIEDCPSDIVRVFEYDMSPNGAGTGGLMMATWYECAYSSRYLGAYYFYNMIKLVNSRNYTLKKIKQIMNLIVPKEMNTAGFTGMNQFADFTKRVMACINEMDNLDDAMSLMNTIYLYGSSINAWQNYRIRWGLNAAFMIRTKEDLKGMGSRAEESYL